jgi:predicted metal-dependent enzyme (double-stranded beta helix superfamily)
VSATAELTRFVAAIDALLRRTDDEPEILAEGTAYLADLVSDDRWLPDSHAVANPDRYSQHLLYKDPAARFSVVSFVWGPGQATPIHDHTVWGLVGMLRGAEDSERFDRREGGLHPAGTDRLVRGQVEAVSPTVGDIHRVANAFADRVSISIHIYGADIGAVERHIFDAAGQSRPFISGYSDAPALLQE